jgi:excisionase family DNA binding protein
MADQPESYESVLLTPDEAADLLKVKPSTVTRLARNGEIPSKKVGGQWRFVRDELEQWLRDAA